METMSESLRYFPRQTCQNMPKYRTYKNILLLVFPPPTGDTTSMALFAYDLWGYGQTYYVLNPNQPGKERNCRAPSSSIDFNAW